MNSQKEITPCPIPWTHLKINNLKSKHFNQIEWSFLEICIKRLHGRCLLIDDSNKVNLGNKLKLLILNANVNTCGDDLANRKCALLSGWIINEKWVRFKAFTQFAVWNVTDQMWINCLFVCCFECDVFLHCVAEGDAKLLKCSISMTKYRLFQIIFNLFTYLCQTNLKRISNTYSDLDRRIIALKVVES